MASGKTYSILEPDFIIEIQQDAPEIQKRVEQDLENAKNKLEDYTGIVLNKAIKNRIYYIDKTFTLDRDIPKYNRLGQKVGILYKKGYQFNPVKYIKVIPPDLIIFNVCEKSEARYIKELLATPKYNDKNNFMLVNSGCKNSKVKKSSFNRKVYYLTNEMKKEFKLKETISIVSVDTIENKIRIEVIKTNENND
jgi:conjugal transfer pilus assembly protein TraW